jgi:hypothetical protein
MMLQIDPWHCILQRSGKALIFTPVFLFVIRPEELREAQLKRAEKDGHQHG